ncbi:MAG: CvpA family protein, partial [Deltaproteobacteria bacterium]|nr:CvpA family protein [Deltaproteobacteria bacterium]
LDYALIIIIGLSVLHGLSHGALRMLTSILAFALGIYGAWKWHGPAAALAQSHVGTSSATSDIIGYVAIFLLVFAAVEIVGQRIIALAELIHLNLLNRLAGAAFGAVLGMLFAGLNIVLLTTLLPPNYPLLQSSELAPEILSYDQRLLEYIPSQVKQVFEDKHSQLARYWNTKRGSPATAESAR